MQTVIRPQSSRSSQLKAPRRRKRPSPLLFLSVAVTVVIVLGAGLFVVILPHIGSRAANVNMDCALTVPADPLSAQGLATPYTLFSANDNGPCKEANPLQSAFVQGAVFDPATNQISVYNPLVIDKGTKPALPPVVPKLPANAVVALWFGFNGATLTLHSTDGSLQHGKCVNGIDDSIFGQVAYCNAPVFFQAVNQAIQAGKLKPPPLGMGKDGLTCPTVRDFGVVDQDQSDNVTTTYLVTSNGRVAQMTAANLAALQNTQTQTNGSDNRLLAAAMDSALGCSPWSVPDLADPGHTVPALPLNELQAAAYQGAPVALVPAGDPMVLNNGDASLKKINAYRVGVDQPLAANLDAASTKTYCQNLVAIGAKRIVQDAPLMAQAPTPDPATGNNLLTFLAQRFFNTYSAANLNCVKLLGQASPITTLQDGNGVAVAALFNSQPINTQTGGTGTGTGTGNGNNGNGNTAPNCKVNGTTITGCAGTTTINGQSCTFMFANNTVTLNCSNTTPGNGNNNGGGNNNDMGGSAKLDFDNSGTSNDVNMTAANFDGWGNSYSAQALQGAGITGQTITFNGVTFTWSLTSAGVPNDVQAMGQVVPVTPVKNATTLAFLGAATDGPSLGNAMITYTDGSTQTLALVFSDWTLNGGRSTPSYGNQVVVTTPYRNTPNGMQMQMSRVFYTEVALQTGKTIKSVTLPRAITHGHIHIFAIGTK